MYLKIKNKISGKKETKICAELKISAGNAANPDFRKSPNLYPNPFTGYIDQLLHLPAGFHVSPLVVLNNKSCFIC
ncbi:MAG: hypothetical protein WCM76_01805 [Bacteroidota bacterium]